MIVSAAIRLDSVTKIFGRRSRSLVALNRVSLFVGVGEIVALVGPNGAGKSTTLKVVATLIDPTSGHATVCGRDTVRDAAAVRRLIGVSLGSERSFYWRLSARHNLAFFARLQGLVGSAIATAVERVADELGIHQFLDAPTRDLSRGVLARLSLARACVHEPHVLILDEPFASVDPVGRALVWDSLQRRAHGGCAVLMATHAVSAAGDCDRMMGIDGGRLIPTASAGLRIAGRTRGTGRPAQTMRR